jgi:hypothetical protein
MACVLLNSIKHLVMKKGETVHWEWGKSEAEGKIEKKHTETASIKSKGSTIKRKATCL